METSLEVGISILTACMNRNENLIKNVRNWCKFDEVNEIIIIDWSSKKEVYSDLIDNDLLSPKIKVVRVLNQTRWILTYAFNIGLQLIKYNKTLKIDSDIYLSDDFFDKNKLNDECFISGNWKTARNNNELHLNGQIYCHTMNLLKVNGYNEFITTYGYDDCDLYKRLINIGLDKIDFCYDTIFHIENTDDERINNQTVSDIDYELVKNSVISEEMSWDKLKRMISFSKLIQQNDNYYTIKNINPKYMINDELIIMNDNKIKHGYLMRKIKKFVPEKYAHRFSYFSVETNIF